MTDATKTPRERPVSPHLVTGGLGSPLLWRWHITMAASILTRVTGVGSYVGLLLVAGWALALASGRDAYEGYMSLLGSIPGQIVLFGIAVTVFYHLAAGVRHLMWDVGKGFQPKTADATALFAFGFGVLAACLVFAYALTAGASAGGGA